MILVENQICDSISVCNLCEKQHKPGLYSNQKETGLAYGYPRTKIKILILTESPPAPGKGFFYDQATGNERLRNEIFYLLTSAGFGNIRSLSDFDKAGFYLADAINCRWNKEESPNLPVSVFTNCLPHLEVQINHFKPEAIITFGTQAKKSVLRINYPHIKTLNLQFPFGRGKYMTETREDRIDKLKNL